MKLVVFGLSISSSWGNGHATLWRGLCRELSRLSHRVVFFERDMPYYRNARDLDRLEGGELVLYASWDEVWARAARELQSADAGIVTSYCPDGTLASELVLERCSGARVFYDLDTPMTLAALERGTRPDYLPPSGLGGFDLVLSFTGGRALELLRERLGARHVDVLYGHVDPAAHHPVAPADSLRADLSYLGTYAADRQAKLEELFLAPAAAAPERRLSIAGSMYPEPGRFPGNVLHIPHLPPAEHAAFFCSSRWTLNLTRDTMARLGHCPSGRLFEAAACGTPLLSDEFEGLELFFEPGSEIEIVRNRADVLRALAASPRELEARAERARRRVLAEHTAASRAKRLLRLLSALPSSAPRSGSST
ncbi:MAG TPA: glycosyltransferase, partial [Polyangiaceae bacterium]|nr:glycosyltransferase [Polyangiaceae bacterium]